MTDFDISTFVLTYLPPEIFGVKTMVFIGMVVGIVIACWSELSNKFIKIKLETGKKSLAFDKRYLASFVVCIVVVVITIEMVLSDGALNNVESCFKAGMIGFVEGCVCIKTLNRRIDIFIMKSAEKNGVPETDAQAIADMVEVQIVEIPKPMPATADENPDTTIEEITLKSL